MSRKTSVWMPLYLGDYLASTTHLSAPQHGAYLLLIFAYWNFGGPISAQEDQLARVARMTKPEWQKSRETLLAFFTRDGDCLRHHRIDEELERAKERYEKRAEGARIANAKRCAQRTQSQSPSQLHSEEETADAVSPPNTRRGSRITRDWQPTDKDIDHAKNRGLDCETITAVAEGFRDHWLAKPGKNGTSLDWSAKWRTWVKNHIGYHGTGSWPRHDGRQTSSNGPRNGSVADTVARLKTHLDLG